MPRKKVEFSFIENDHDRRVSYRKREKGLLRKAQELKILCDVEIAAIIFSPYKNEPTVFPDHDSAVNILTKFRELPPTDRSKKMMTRNQFIMKRIAKLNEKLIKLRKKNRVKEFTNEMSEVLNGKEIPIDMQAYNVNDLSYIIKRNLKEVREAIKEKIGEEESTSNIPQSIIEPMIPSWTNIEGPHNHLLSHTSLQVSMVPPMSPSTFSSQTNYEWNENSLFVPNLATTSVALPTVSLSTSHEFSDQMFHQVDPLRAPLQLIPLIDPPHVLQYPLSFSEMLSPMFPQLDSLIPQNMAVRTPDNPTSSITIASPMPSPLLAPQLSALVCSPMTSQMDPLTEIPPTDAPMPMDNYQINFLDTPQSLPLLEIFNWNNDDAVTLLEDLSLNNINAQDPKNNNNI